MCFAVTLLDILVRMDQGRTIFGVFPAIFFPHFTRRLWLNLEKILFLKNLGRLWVVSEKFWLERWSIVRISRCLDHAQSRLHYSFFQRKRPEHFTCFLFLDVIIYFNVVLLLFSNSSFFDEFKTTKCRTKTMSLLSLLYLYLPQHQTL